MGIPLSGIGGVGTVDDQAICHVLVFLLREIGGFGNRVVDTSNAFSGARLIGLGQMRDQIPGNCRHHVASHFLVSQRHGDADQTWAF